MPWGFAAASRKSGAEVVQGCRTEQRAAWMHGVATARQFFGVQKRGVLWHHDYLQELPRQRPNGAADRGAAVLGLPSARGSGFTQTVEQAKLYGTPWSPDTHQRIEELEERVREVEASQQLLLPPSAQPLVLPAPAQQRTKAAWRKRR